MKKNITITIAIKPDCSRGSGTRKAQWIAKREKGEERDRLHYCSNCGFDVELLAQKGIRLDRILYFCPWCGSRMFRGRKKKNVIGEECKLTVCEDLSEEEKQNISDMVDEHFAKRANEIQDVLIFD